MVAGFAHAAGFSDKDRGRETRFLCRIFAFRSGAAETAIVSLSETGRRHSGLNPRLFDVTSGKEIPIANDLFPNPWSLEFQRWSDDGTRFWLLYNERGHQRMRVLEVMTATGDVRAAVDESSGTFIHYSSDGKLELKWLKDDKLLWASERTGWNHLYRYDVASGTLLNAVTSGDWNVRRLEHIDEESGQVWFFAVGLNPGQDPYHEHFCRVNLDGSGFIQLTDGDGTHAIAWSPDKKWLIDRYSRIDLPPVTELRSADKGTPMCHLEAADASEIIAAGPVAGKIRGQGARRDHRHLGNYPSSQRL